MTLGPRHECANVIFCTISAVGGQKQYGILESPKADCYRFHVLAGMPTVNAASSLEHPTHTIFYFRSLFKERGFVLVMQKERELDAKKIELDHV